LSLYGFLYRTPLWAQPPGGNGTSMPTSLATWSNFVYRAVDHYRGTIDYWEIYNEPCFQFTSAQYLALVQTASVAAKAQDGRLEWRDLTLDVLATPAGRLDVLDEHELPKDLDPVLRTRIAAGKQAILTDPRQVMADIEERSRALYPRVFPRGTRPAP